MPNLRPASINELTTDGGRLRIVLNMDDEGPRVVDVRVSEPDRYALPHVHALHGHSNGCPGRADLQVDLLLRTCEALGSPRPTIVVRPNPEPAFWLRVQGADSTRDLPLGVLDAIVLLASRRVSVAADVGRVDWDEALRDLLSDGSAESDG